MSLDDFLGRSPLSSRTGSLQMVILSQTEAFANVLSALACTFRFQGKSSRKFKYIRLTIVGARGSRFPQIALPLEGFVLLL